MTIEGLNDLMNAIEKLTADMKKIEDSIGGVKAGTNHYHLAPNHTLYQIGNIVTIAPEKKEKEF